MDIRITRIIHKHLKITWVINKHSYINIIQGDSFIGGVQPCNDKEETYYVAVLEFKLLQIVLIEMLVTYNLSINFELFYRLNMWSCGNL